MDETEKQIEDIERKIRETPYHKGTEHHIGRLRARLARLYDKILERKQKKVGGGAGFAVKKFGDATVVLVGFPSVGKSTLLNALTNAKSPVGEYAFTTVSVIPGMMKYKDASIQILDVPGLIAGAAHGRGRGRAVLSVIRSADLLLIMAELGREEEQFSKINQELFSNGIRINQSPPKIQIRKTSSGGIKIHCSIQSLDSRTIQEVAKEFGIVNAEISIGEKVDLERLVDAFAKNRVWVPAIYVVNKAERSQAKEMEDVIFISAKEGLGLDKLQEEIWKKLKLVRVFLREEPVIMRENETLLDLAYKIGSDFAGSKKSAKIWGPSARFPGQTVPLSTKVQEGMKVEFV